MRAPRRSGVRRWAGKSEAELSQLPRRIPGRYEIIEEEGNEKTRKQEDYVSSLIHNLQNGNSLEMRVQLEVEVAQTGGRKQFDK